MSTEKKITQIPAEFDHNKKIVNGPLNVVRLEGEIDGIKKVLYCYMDVHLSPANQTENENVFSTDVAKHLADNFIKLNGESHTVDFFMEINPSMIKKSILTSSRPNLKNKYIIQVYKLFQKSFKLDPENKVTQPEIFKNTRFHYADIRDCLFISLFDELMLIGSDLKQTLNKKINPMMLSATNSTYGETRRILGILDSYLCGNLTVESDKLKPDPKMAEATNKINAVINDIIATKAKESGKVIPQIKQPEQPPSMYQSGFKANIHRRTKLFNKYLNKYTHDLVKKNINTLLTEMRMRIGGLSTYLKESIEVTNYYLAEFKKLDGRMNFDITELEHTLYTAPNSFIDKMASDLLFRHNKISSEFLHILSAMMDIFMIRRFTDKDYITNAVYYSGAAHSCNVVYWLVKNFGFKITHTGNTDLRNKSEVEIFNGKVMNHNFPEMLMPILMPNRLNQSTDMTSMPDNYL